MAAKVYSIWVYMNAPSETGNAIAAYSLAKRDLLGSLPDNPGAYDKAEVVVIALNGEPGAGDELTGMLNLMLSSTITEQDKAKRLKSEYDMSLTDDDARRMSGMGGWSEYYEEHGAYRKVEELVLRNLKAGKKPEEIAEWFGLTVEEVREIERKALTVA